MKRFYLEFDPCDKILLDGEQFIHLAFVLRSKIGDRVILCRNDEYDYIYEIAQINKKFAELKFIEKRENIYNPRLFVRLLPALEKGDKLEFVVQKAVELGISEIVPVKTEFCQIKTSSVRVDRLQKIANEACKQCGRSKTAIVKGVEDLYNISVNSDEENLNCFLYEGKCEKSLMAFLAETDKSKIKNVNIIIGSEGGFSEKEVEFFKAKNIKPLTLGSRILRAETACVSVCAIIMAEMGELQ